LRCKRVWDVNHVSDATNRLSDGQVIVVHAGQRLGRQRWAEEIVRLEIADGLPERSEKVGSHLQARFTGHFAVRETEQFPLVSAQLRRSVLLGDADAPRLFTRATVMPRLAVRANNDLRLQCAAEPAPQQLERAPGRKLVVVEVGVNEEHFHWLQGWLVA